MKNQRLMNWVCAARATCRGHVASAVGPKAPTGGRQTRKKKGAAQADSTFLKCKWEISA
jgi:hypothetical protein